MRKINKIINIVLIFMLIGVFLCSDIVYSKEVFTLRVPSIFSFGKTDSKKSWETVKKDYLFLIEAAFSEEELKKVYRKMAKEVHPDHNKGEEKKAEEVFKYLADKIEKKLKKDFKFVPEDLGVDATDLRWMDLWASITPEYERDNDMIMGESVVRLKERASRLDQVIGGNDAVIKFLAEKSINLSMDKIDRLLDITSKELFASELLSITQKTAISRGNISDKDIWKVRPLLERLYLANQLREGEIVFIRIGNRIERTVILKPLTKSSPILKAITVGAPFKGPVDYGPIGENDSRFIELTPKEIVADLVDFEREPKQKGYTINIGDILEIDNGYEPPFKVTVYGVHAHYFHAIAHKRHHNLKNSLGYGYDFGTYAGEDALMGRLGKQRITKIELPKFTTKPRHISEKRQLKLLQRQYRTDS